MNGGRLSAGLNHRLIRQATRAARRYLVGPAQRWVFERPAEGWRPERLDRTSLYLHVPFCRHCCPYCPYTKVAYDETLIEPYTQSALAEVDWWAGTVGRAEITSVYIGGGTPTLALDSVARVIDRVQERFRLTGDICIETNPADVDEMTVCELQEMGIRLVSLGVQSFHSKNLATLGRGYSPDVGERALHLLAKAGFASVNVDLIFALPDQESHEVTSDLEHAADLGADQITTYPLFTFPYTSVGEYLCLKAVRMPNLQVRREQYQAISRWCSDHGFERVSVWGFKRGNAPRYSSVTRDGYIGIGPGTGSHLPDGFVLNSFDLDSWGLAARSGRPAIALRLPFTTEMSGWWWLYWRFYDTRIPLATIGEAMGKDVAKARRWLKVLELSKLAKHQGDCLYLSEAGAFWLHLVQNYFALNYVNTLWTAARREPWPDKVEI